MESYPLALRALVPTSQVSAGDAVQDDQAAWALTAQGSPSVAYDPGNCPAVTPAAFLPVNWPQRPPHVVVQEPAGPEAPEDGWKGQAGFSSGEWDETS